MKVLLLQAFVALAMLGNVFAIHCFSCNSAKDARCGEPFKPYVQGIVNCDDEVFATNETIKATICRKLQQTSKRRLTDELMQELNSNLFFSSLRSSEGDEIVRIYSADGGKKEETLFKKHLRPSIGITVLRLQRRFVQRSAS